MQVAFEESLVINGQEVRSPTLTQRGYANTLSADPLRQNFGEMIVQTLANQSLSEKQRLYIAEMLEEQLHIELNTRENLRHLGLPV